MSYFIEFQPQEVDLMWSILLEGKVSGKDAPVMTALLQNIQNAVQSQNEAQNFDQELSQNIAEGNPLPGEEKKIETPEVKVEKAE